MGKEEKQGRKKDETENGFDELHGWLPRLLENQGNSKSIAGSFDCRIIDFSVPIRISRWFGTGTVMVLPGMTFCSRI